MCVSCVIIKGVCSVCCGFTGRKDGNGRWKERKREREEKGRNRYFTQLNLASSMDRNRPNVHPDALMDGP